MVNSEAIAVKTLLDNQDFGVLSTYSVDVEGFPFGSVTAYALSNNYHPLIYISNIAQHTKNIARDNRVALTILENVTDVDSPNPQNHGRVTFIGKAIEVPEIEEEISELHQKYYQRFSDGEIFQKAYGFYLFKIEPVRIRYIGGFGKIFWLEPSCLEEL
jgi:heme iron utilization protein